jgi:hypothetical protein
MYVLTLTRKILPYLIQSRQANEEPVHVGKAENFFTHMHEEELGQTT